MNRIILSLLCLSLFFSCADNEAQVANVSAITVFDFKDEQSSPTVRLSVFAEAVSPVNRGSYILIRNEDTGLSWKAVNLTKATDSSKKSWTGFSSFEVPKNFTLPQGVYSFTYGDYAENSCEAKFKVFYNSEYASCKSSDFPQKIAVTKNEKYIFMNEKDDIIFYGDRKKEWTSLERAAKDYKNAYSGRICYYVPSSSTMVLMPLVTIKQKPAQEDLTKNSSGDNAGLKKDDSDSEGAL